MQQILNRTALENNVAPQFLEHLGTQDERESVGKVLYHFTIMDPIHEQYRSTVAYTEIVQ